MSAAVVLGIILMIFLSLSSPVDLYTLLGPAAIAKVSKEQYWNPSHRRLLVTVPLPQLNAIQLMYCLVQTAAQFLKRVVL
jgi:hypothetical protein